MLQARTTHDTTNPFPFSSLWANTKAFIKGTSVYIFALSKCLRYTCPTKQECLEIRINHEKGRKGKPEDKAQRVSLMPRKGTAVEGSAWLF